MAPGAFLRRILACTVLFAAVAVAGAAAAQDHSRTLLLVARPGLPDSNFRAAVVLVTQDEKANGVGLIVNRPTQRSLASILPGEGFKNRLMLKARTITANGPMTEVTVNQPE